MTLNGKASAAREWFLETGCGAFWEAEGWQEWRLAGEREARRCSTQPAKRHLREGLKELDTRVISPSENQKSEVRCRTKAGKVLALAAPCPLQLYALACLVFRPGEDSTGAAAASSEDTCFPTAMRLYTRGSQGQKKPAVRPLHQGKGQAGIAMAAPERGAQPVWLEARPLS